MAKKRNTKTTKTKRKRTAKKNKPKRDAEALDPVGTYVPSVAT
jgi:hypothetical protein